MGEREVRPKLYIYTAVFLLLAVFLQKGARAELPVLTNDEVYLMELVNAARINPGSIEESACTPVQAPPLVWSGVLVEAAQFHSQEMVDNDYFDHDSVDEFGVHYEDFQGRVDRFGYTGYFTIGENVGWTSGDVLLMFETFLATQIHCENIFHLDYNETGIGIRGPSTYVRYTQDFGGIDYSDTGEGVITGVIYNDLNNNGYYDAGEGLEGMLVTTDSSGYSTLTQPGGSYLIKHVTTATYTVSAGAPGYETNQTASVDVTEGEAAVVVLALVPEIQDRCYNGPMVLSVDAMDSSGVNSVSITVEDYTSRAADNVSGDTWTATFTGVPEGPGTWWATAADGCGSGNSGVSEDVRFTVDLTLPQISIASPTDGSTVNSSTVIVTGTVSDPGSGIFWVCVSLDQDECLLADLQGGSWEYTFLGVSTGPHTLVATTKDNCRNIMDSAPIGINVSW
ncbi:MAG: hypothetical protein JSU92_03415 [Deltaproteobacteria bacterium]|nr:MAG: hypothetical protein JSU92_03415 [Deltaproteobacteria bacterium]